MFTAVEMARSQPGRRGLVRGPAAAWMAWPRQAAAVAIFFLIAWLANCAAWLAARRRPARGAAGVWQERARKLCVLWRWLAVGLGIVRLRVERPEAFRGLEGVVVAANHPSLLDAFVLLGVVPKAVCVMRAGLRRNFSLGPLAELAGYLPNDRGPALMRAGRRKLREGSNLVVFPEGTRSEGASPGPFKPGFALAAMLAGAPVLPVGIRYEGTAFRKGRGLLAASALPGEMVVRPGSPLRALPGENARELARRVREECLRLMA
ncbi:MAG: 1-acyl-sn-glycerol-3-phosphate acyltransferase [Terrimicrobiaceae bacterium]|nr:1-acyl-sn-glycerol-3-phosphate acyltransferase [Terrimicrobiaceae bacterium]